jgi:hypothetical protein
VEGGPRRGRKSRGQRGRAKEGEEARGRAKEEGGSQKLHTEIVENQTCFAVH